MAGPTKPPRLPIELMVAIPVAAAGPDRKSVGMLHSGGLAALMPTLTSVRAVITATTVFETPASAKPAAATRQAMTTCHVRSFWRSECHDHRYIAMTAMVGGIALKKPTSRLVRPNPLMICGAQIPSV